MIGWRASCMMAWDTPEGGPCVLRPTPNRAADAPDPTHTVNDCALPLDQWADDLKAVASTSSKCAGASFDENNILRGAGYQQPMGEFNTPFSEDLPDNSEFTCVRLSKYI